MMTTTSTTAATFASFIILIVHAAVIVVAQDEVVTCGGFVEATSQISHVISQRLDYSFVSVHLYTSDGLLKYSSECAPNGYYFIPIYDRGSYVLRIDGPDGWNFEPKEVTVEVNEQERGCVDDVNFKFTGFALSGHLTSTRTDECAVDADAGTTGGPAGVAIKLVSSERNELATTVTDGRGAFVFDNVFPDNYTVKVVVDGGGGGRGRVLAVVPTEQSVAMSFGNTEMSSPFVVDGYTVDGRITSDQAGVAGVDVFLYGSASAAALLKCTAPPADTKVPSSPPPSTSSSSTSSWVLLCHTQSTSDGSFAFARVPCGDFYVMPYYHRTTTTYEVVPKHVPVSVGHRDETLAAEFRVLGFSVRGRVVDKQGVGVDGATIRLTTNNNNNNNDEAAIAAVTDAQGYYQLEKVTTGVHTVQATKLHVFFHDLKSVQLSPNMVLLPDITVVRYHLCGRVDAVDGATSTARKVVLVNEKFQQRLIATTDASGHYCFEVVSGDYTIVPSVTAEEEAQGVLLSPPRLAVKVTNAPVLNAFFSHSRIRLSGVVRCIVRPCDTSALRVHLSSKSDSTIEQTVAVNGADGAYAFENVFPGKYVVSVVHESWCWTKQVLRVTAEYDDITDLDFVQSGYMLHSVISHGAALNFTIGDKQILLDVATGDNKFCLADPGVYEVRASSCYRFKEDTLTYDTRRPSVLRLEVTAFLLRGFVVLHMPAQRSAAQVMIIAKTPLRETNALAEEIMATRVDPVPDNFNWKGDGGGGDVVVYEYAFYAQPRTQYRLEPQTFVLTMSPDAPNDTTTEPIAVLFHPRSIDVSASGESCPPVCAPIEARAGLYIAGAVTPVVGAVTVSVAAKSDPNTVLHSVDTNAVDGKYRVGPLDDTQEYVVRASKFGYQLVPTAAGHNFRAMRLGEIRVMVKDESGAPLDGVLLSLSGEGYRNNSVVDASGQYVFEGLRLSQYFVRPHMKEYEFIPKAQSIDVSESGAMVVTFTATRVAYSAFGVVRSLNGEPEPNAVVESYVVDSRQRQREETLTDKNGQYRLRGLNPGPTYAIRVKTKDGNQMERAAPAEYRVVMANDDVTGIDFVSMRKLTRFDITGRVSVPSQWLHTVKVELAAESVPNVVIKSQILRKNKDFFEFNAMPEDNYVVVVRCSLSTRTHSHSAQEVHVQLHDHTFINPVYDITTKTVNPEIGQDSMSSLIISALVLAAFFYRRDLTRAIKDMVAANSSSNGDDDNAPGFILPQNVSNGYNGSSSSSSSSLGSSASRRKQRRKL